MFFSVPYRPSSRASLLAGSQVVLASPVASRAALVQNPRTIACDHENRRPLLVELEPEPEPRSQAEPEPQPEVEQEQEQELELEQEREPEPEPELEPEVRASARR